MTTPMSENFETVAPSEADALLARESSRRLATHKLGKRSSIRIQLLDDGEAAETVAVPASALRLFLHLLVEMSQANAVNRHLRAGRTMAWGGSRGGRCRHRNSACRWGTNRCC